ncbi:molybdopterin-dependent oxidoreductase [Acetobacteraceae bacterium KSS8]|uniref:Molybdopterin-dependent oxidoreductase n=1 Tax=Endosaccharibacter trunci TaxID=2812733 RepID=A0ABT1W6K5_9PROT|nr:molybdopterin-dependent oxidoreductase [Acetobacteraceae bacterium KSS8]
MSRKRVYSAAHWGVYEVEQHNGAPVLHPLRDDPSPSPIGLDQLDESVQRLRVRKPSVRRGWLEHGPRAGGGGRGQEPFVEIGWDECLDRLAEELDRVRTEHGNAAIFGGSYGWSSAGRFHHAQSQLHRFLNMAGGYVRSVDSYSLGAANVLMPHIVAPMLELNATVTSWDVIMRHSRLFVTFGGVPAKNAQVSSGGAGRHRVPSGLRAAAQAGVRFVNISPVRDNIDTGGPVEWIPIRPNTDTAMMLALAYAMISRPDFDAKFVGRYCVGFAQFRAYVTGESDGQAKTPLWASDITGVPAARISALADEILENRTMLNAAWALQRAAHGEQPFWALVALAAVAGQIGLPGGGFAVGYGPMNLMGSAHPRFGGPTLNQGRNPVDAFIPVARVADMLLRPGDSFTYNGKTHTYPDIRMAWWAGGNPFHHHQDLNRLAAAFRRPDTLVVQEQFWTATARMADIVLPVTTTLERNDVGFSTREGLVIAMRQATPPVGESRDDHSILAAVARRLGFEAAFTENLDEMGWLRRLYDESRDKAGLAGIAMPPFEQFWDDGLIDLSPYDAPHVAFAAFRADPDRHPLQTPSGRIELYSERIASFGLQDCPGHAVWRPPFEWLGADAAERYPLHLISDQPATRLHSQLDHAPHSQAAKAAGREPCHISPQDAAKRGISDGDLVELFNDRGRCLSSAVVDAAVMQGVIRMATGAWLDMRGTLENNGNPNVLTLDRGASSLSQGCAAQTCLVEIRRVEDMVPQPVSYAAPPFVRRP